MYKSCWNILYIWASLIKILQQECYWQKRVFFHKIPFLRHKNNMIINKVFKSCFSYLDFNVIANTPILINFYHMVAFIIFPFYFFKTWFSWDFKCFFLINWSWNAKILTLIITYLNNTYNQLVALNGWNNV